LSGARLPRATQLTRGDGLGAAAHVADDPAASFGDRRAAGAKSGFPTRRAPASAFASRGPSGSADQGKGLLHRGRRLGHCSLRRQRPPRRPRRAAPGSVGGGSGLGRPTIGHPRRRGRVGGRRRRGSGPGSGWGHLVSRPDPRPARAGGCRGSARRPPALRSLPSCPPARPWASRPASTRAASSSPSPGEP
jgi:hypothetical protein